MHKIREGLIGLAVPTDSLIRYPDNPRIGVVDLIAESLRENGQFRSIVARTQTREVLAGNHTLQAARNLGWDQIATVFVTVDDDTARKIMLVDNRSGDSSGYDLLLLLGLLESVEQLAGTGYSRADVDKLVEDVKPADLDTLVADLGPPSHDVGWPTLTIRVDPDTAERWKILVGNHGGDQVAALAALLGVEL